MARVSGFGSGGHGLNPAGNGNTTGVDYIAAPAMLVEWAGRLRLRGSFALALRRIDATDVAGLHCLTAAEIARGAAFAAEQRRRQWLAGRIAAKHAVARLICQTAGASHPSLRQPTGWTIVADRDGRPLLRATGTELLCEAPDISISHSADLAVAMAASRGRCGIDIQRLTKKILKVRSRFCLASEAAVLAAAPDLRDVTAIGRYTLLWVVKEALIKAAATRFMDVAVDRIMPIATDTAATGYLVECRRLGTPNIEPFRLLAFLAPDYAMALVVLQ